MTLAVPMIQTPPGLPEFEVDETFRIAGRGVVAVTKGDPLPWWPIAVHRVRVLRPDGSTFEADASVEIALIRSGVEKMAPLFRGLQVEDLPRGCRVVSLGYTPHPQRQVEVVPPPARRWWQFWKGE